MKQKKNKITASFRDPAGYMYHDHDGTLLRHITKVGVPDFVAAADAGLHDELIRTQLLVPHTVIKPRGTLNDKTAEVVIKPEVVFPISYPFEWSFSMLKDAALTTLKIQKIALKRGLSLKDASAYNIQFVGGKPLLIDTLSFEKYKPGTPWVAYGQFCRHFLAPLALMSTRDVRLSRMLGEYIDGIPLDLAVKILPKRSRLRPAFLMHLHLHARAQHAKASTHTANTKQVRSTNLLAIIDSLERSISRLQPARSRTEWMDYYDNTNYSDNAAKHKEKLIAEFAAKIPNLSSVLDIGGNDGHYSQPFADQKITTICADVDPFAVEYNYRRVRKKHDTHMLPLLFDLVNPAGAMGWANNERPAFPARCHTDVAMALALVHHLAISNNLPFEMIAEHFSEFAPYLIIEFVPKEDSQVQKLLSTRKDIFPQYTKEDFETAFKQTYRIVAQENVRDSKRTLYLMKRK